MKCVTIYEHSKNHFYSNNKHAFNQLITLPQYVVAVEVTYKSCFNFILNLNLMLSY